MIREHHIDIVRAAVDVVASWGAGKPPGGLYRLQRFLDGPRIEQIEEWTAAADTILDVVVDEQLSGNVLADIGNMTCFQHFTYGGSLGVLVDGDTRVAPGDGYCWDCDPFMPWYASLAGASTANVRYDAACGFLPKEILEKSPGAKSINGAVDWDNQVYPASADLIRFYMSVAEQQRHSAAGDSLKSMCCVLHLLQDLCVPHHVLNTIGRDHALWEKQAHNYWKLAYSSRNHTRARIANIAKDVYAKQHRIPEDTDMEHLVMWAINQTCWPVMGASGAVRNGYIDPVSRASSWEMSTRAIACTIRALEIYVKGE